MEMPQPDIKMPRHIIQGRECLSAMEPNTGWITEPMLLRAKVNPAAEARLIPF